MKVFFYSNVSNISSFNLSKFYLDDINALNYLGYEVVVSNRIVKFFSVKNCNGVLIYFYSKGLILAVLSRIFNKKVVFTGGVDDLQTSNNFSIRVFTFILCYVFSNVCNVVSISDYNRLSSLLKFYGFNSRKLIYTPHYIDLNVNLNTEHKDKIITTICWLGSVANVKRKGVDKLLYFFNKIKHLGFSLYIIGGGVDGAKYLKEIVRDLGLDSLVYFKGGISHNDKYEILAKSKYYFQLSEYEGFGLAVLEAIYFHNYIFHSGKGGLIDTIGLNGTILSEVNIDNFLELFNEVDSVTYNSFDFLKLKLDILSKFSFDRRVNLFQHFF